jgi:toxin secretion/phage lysis holin
MVNIQKSIFGAIAYVFSFLSGCVGQIIIILAILMCFDYVTGVTVAKKEGTFDKNKGSWGAVKKLFYIMIIVTAYLADLSITLFAKKIGLDFQTYGSLGFAVTFYLIGNEGVSLYTNWIKLGLPAPKFISNIFNNIKLMAGASIPKELENKRKKDRNG